MINFAEHYDPPRKRALSGFRRKQWFDHPLWTGNSNGDPAVILQTLAAHRK